jgi:hypothetical protein
MKFRGQNISEIISVTQYKLPILKVCLPSAYTLVSLSAYFSTLAIETMCSSKTSVECQGTTRRYNHSSENLRSYVF